LKHARLECFSPPVLWVRVRSIVLMQRWGSTKTVVAAWAAFSALNASAACFDEAAERYQVPVVLLKAISTVESGGNPSARNVNKDGSHDIGHMQINSSWLPTLAKFNIDEKTLADPCINTHIGAWVLAHNIARLGLSWDAVGAYNAKSPSKRLVYAHKVARVLEKQAAKKQPSRFQGVASTAPDKQHKRGSS